MSIFTSDKDLLVFAEAFLEERKISLIRDTENCLTGTAPFPAIIYCFSVIDLMGALSSGEATKEADTGKIAREYMLNFMGYTNDQVNMLQKVFRHKIIHLSQPLFVTKDGVNKIAWAQHNDNRKEHLKIEIGLAGQDIQAPAGIPINLFTRPIRYNATFIVSIKSLAEDICKSIDIYISVLKNDTALQHNFDKAIEVISGA